MSVIEFLSEPIWQRLGLTLLHFLWQGLAIAVLFGLIIRLFRLSRGNNQYIACLLAFLAMSACPVATFLTLDTPIKLLATPISTQVITGPIVSSLDTLPVLPVENTQAQASVASSEIAEPVKPVSSIPLPERIADYLHTSLPWAISAWLVGVFLLSIRLLMGFVGVHRWRRRLEPLPDNLAQRVTLLAERLGLRSIARVLVSPSAVQAVAIGYFRPMVLLPAAMITQMPPEMLEAVIAHELAHIRRFDLWINLLQRIAETLLFYHPALWWLSNRLRSERELCCDELAIQATGQRLTYASTLELAGRANLTAKQPALAVGLGRDRKPILTRVRHVLGFAPAPQNSRFWLAGLITVTFLAALAVPTALVLTAKAQTDLQVAREGVGQKREDEKGNAYLDAIIEGNLGKVQESLANDPNLIYIIDNRGKGSSRLPALHLAIKYDHADIVELLLSKGAKPNERDINGQSSLQVAAHNGRANMVKLLVQYGADINEKDEFQHPPLCYASNAQVAEALIANGADVNWRYPLHFMARYGTTTAAQVLLAHGADINAKDNSGGTPLHSAASRGRKDMVEFLITKGADINAKDRGTRGKTPLNRVVTDDWMVPEVDRKATAELLISHGADFTIYDVTWLGDVTRVRKLLKNNPSLANDIINTYREPVLFAAIREGHSAIAELLLDNGADLNVKDRYKEPPLHAAAYPGHKNMVALLLRKGVDVNQKGPHGELALHWAAAKGHSQITQLLVEAGTEVNTHTDKPRMDMNGVAEGNADVIHECLRYLADEAEAMRSGLLQIRGLIRLAFAAEDTPLHSAAQRGHKEIVELLLANGADVNITNRWDQTPLHYAVVFRHEEVVKALLNAGANPNAKMLDGSTAHDLASKVKDAELANMLRIEHNTIEPDPQIQGEDVSNVVENVLK